MHVCATALADVLTACWSRGAARGNETLEQVTTESFSPPSAKASLCPASPLSRLSCGVRAGIDTATATNRTTDKKHWHRQGR
eukprot:884122-Rhodomonas_salina.1